MISYCLALQRPVNNALLKHLEQFQQRIMMIYRGAERFATSFLVVFGAVEPLASCIVRVWEIEF